MFSIFTAPVVVGGWEGGVAWLDSDFGLASLPCCSSVLRDSAPFLPEVTEQSLRHESHRSLVRMDGSQDALDFIRFAFIVELAVRAGRLVFPLRLEE